MLLLLIAACFLGGPSLLVWSWFERRKRNRLAGIEEVPLSAAERGRTIAVSGVADVPVPIASPVTGTPCVFYEKQDDVPAVGNPDLDDTENPVALGVLAAGRLAWVRQSVEHAGGFFLMDSGSMAFVFPRGARLRVAGEHQNSAKEAGPDDVRRITERFIPQGRTVCVIGRAHAVAEALQVIREDASMAPETLEKLRAAGPIPCFFDDGAGAFEVADMAFADLRADAAESAGALFWTGLVLVGLGLLFIADFFLAGFRG